MIPTKSGLAQKPLREPQEISYPRVAFGVTCLHCLFVVTWFLQLGSRKDFLGAIRFEFFLGTCLLLISFLFLPVATPSSHQKTILRPLWFFIASLVVGLLISENFTVSLDVVVDRVVKFAFMGVFAVAFVRGPRQLKWFIAAFMLAWLKIEQESVLGILTGSLLWQNQAVTRLHGTTGLYESPNSLAGLALGTLPFLYYLFPLMPLAGKLLWGVMMVMANAVIIYTGSRTGYVGLAFFIVFLLKDSRHKFKAFIVIATAALLLGQLAPSEYWARFETIFTGQEMEGQSMDKRKEIIQDAIEILIKHPLGVGPGSFPSVRERYYGRNQDTHNLYLEVATNLGVQGLIFFLVFIYAILKGLSQLIKNITLQLTDLEKLNTSNNNSFCTEHMKDLKLVQATARAVYGYLLIRLVLGMFGHDLYEVYWWFSLGLTLALLNMNVFASDRTKQLISQHNVGLPKGASTDRRYI